MLETLGHLLSSEGKSSTSDGGGKIEAFGDFSPQFFVDDFHKPTLGYDQSEQLVQI